MTASQAMPFYGRQLGSWHVKVTAANRGRGPTTVTGWGLRTVDGANFFPLRPHTWSSPIPYPMPPGGQEGSWFIETDEVKAGCLREGQDHRTLRAWVRLSDGREVFAKRRGIEGK